MYEIHLYQGNYRDRQLQANNDGCVAYIEHHFNSSSSSTANYAVVITGSNASQTSKNWGRWYSEAIAREFDIFVGGEQGIKVGGYGGRGDYNLRYTSMPAILLEPLFASNPKHAEWIRHNAGQARLARILSESIQRFFPEGGLIGFSVGHKYKLSRPNDRGAAVYGGGTEGDNAEQVLEMAKTLLEQVGAPQIERKIKVFLGEEELWTHTVDEDADVKWDPVLGVLRIDQG